jgi:hypothetical protein
MQERQQHDQSVPWYPISPTADSRELWTRKYSALKLTFFPKALDEGNNRIDLIGLQNVLVRGHDHSPLILVAFVHLPPDFASGQFALGQALCAQLPARGGVGLAVLAMAGNAVCGKDSLAPFAKHRGP